MTDKAVKTTGVVGGIGVAVIVAFREVVSEWIKKQTFPAMSNNEALILSIILLIGITLLTMFVLWMFGKSKSARLPNSRPEERAPDKSQVANQSASIGSTRGGSSNISQSVSQHVSLDNRNQHVFSLASVWSNVNHLDCNKLIGPDVTSAENALTLTATSWLENLVPRPIILKNHFSDFKSLFEELQSCPNTLIPGFEIKPVKKCGDVLTKEIRQAYAEMLAEASGGIQ